MVRSDWESELTVPVEGHVEHVTVVLIDAAEVMGPSILRTVHWNQVWKCENTTV